MKTYGGVDVNIHVFLTSALFGSEWPASRRGRFTPRGNRHGYPLNRRLGGPQNRSRWRGKEKILDHTGTRTPTPRPSSLQPVAIPTELSWLRYVEILWWKTFHSITLIFEWWFANGFIERAPQSTYCICSSDEGNTTIFRKSGFKPLEHSGNCMYHPL
jgi:hypothetical protein